MTYGIYTDYNGKDQEKTMMETVSCTERHQRAGDGGNPVQVDTAENPSGVSFPKTGHRQLTEKNTSAGSKK